MDDVKKTLKKLMSDAEVKAMVDRLISIAKLPESDKQQMLPHLHLIAKDGSGITTIGRFYADLLREYKIFFPYAGKKDYLELNFPYGVSEKKYQLFFQSLREAAETKNMFYGVVVIGLNEWKDKALDTEEMFASFVKFVQDNKENVRFVFLTDSDENFSARMNAYLKKYVMVETLRLPSPDEKQSMEYLISLLEKKKIELTLDGNEELTGLVNKMCEEENWKGYRSLKELGRRLECEQRISGTDGKLGVEIVGRVAKDFLPSGVAEKKTKIGFTM